MLNWLRRLVGIPVRDESLARRPVRATYDNAQQGGDNARHWVHADALSSRRANTPGVRATLRQRARYEVANNSYAQGIVRTMANNLVGKGPRLRLKTTNDAVNHAVESRWQEWARPVRLADKLRTAKQAKTVDGEGIGILVNNPMLRCSVKLDVMLIEADQMTDLFTDPLDPLAVDGIRFDEWGNPTEYRFLPHHPGDWVAPAIAVKRVHPRNVLHWFKRDRPGQLRGVSELTPALNLFGQLRRFTTATLTAAETAASFAAVLQTDGPAMASDTDDFDAFDIEHGLQVKLPAGWEMKQFEPKHPAANYEMFLFCLIREICRCLSLPLNIALGDSSKYNFSSARLDHLIYRQAVAVEREDCECECLEPTFEQWLSEATLIPGYLPANLPADAASLPHCWEWPAWEPIDALGEAQADTERLTSGTASLPEVAAEQGRDWRELVREQVRVEVYREQLRRELGAPAPAPAAAPAQAEGVPSNAA
jgi:lambda family phage portal protein